MSELIKRVRRFNLCTGCGTCAGLCPSGAIKMSKDESKGLYLPQVSEEKCIHCGICAKSCPGYELNLEYLRRSVYGKPLEDNLLGNYLNCYIGHSNDEAIRFNSTSGGIATQLLLFALERKIISGAAVARMKQDKPLETEVFIAKSGEELLEAARSKYCPVSTNEVLDQIMKEKGRMALVGLPCHMHGLRRAEEAIKPLKMKRTLSIGLMCSHEVSFKGTEFMVEKLGVRKSDVEEISYRGYGWPSGLTLKARGRTPVKIPLFGSWRSYWPVFSSFFFTPQRCIMCPDQTCEFSDFSLGDAWLPELRSDHIGESIIVTRTREADEILNAMHREEIISLRKVAPEKVVQSQSLNLKFKKTDLPTRLWMMRKLGHPTPVLDYPVGDAVSTLSLFRSMYAYWSMKASSHSKFVNILKGVPFPLFRLYHGIYKLASMA